MTGDEIAGGRTGPSRSGEIRDHGKRVSKTATRGQAARKRAVDSGMQLVDRIRILVEHLGMSTDALDGFPCGQLSREKALYASTNDEGLFVLQVQTSQYGKIAQGPATHRSMLRIPAAQSIREFEQNSDIRNRYGAGRDKRECAMSRRLRNDPRSIIRHLFALHLEPSGLCRRLHFVRGWGNAQKNEICHRCVRMGGADGVRS